MTIFCGQWPAVKYELVHILDLRALSVWQYSSLKLSLELDKMWVWNMILFLTMWPYISYSFFPKTLPKRITLSSKLNHIFCNFAVPSLCHCLLTLCCYPLMVSLDSGMWAVSDTVSILGKGRRRHHALPLNSLAFLLLTLRKNMIQVALGPSRMRVI